MTRILQETAERRRRSVRGSSPSPSSGPTSRASSVASSRSPAGATCRKREVADDITNDADITTIARAIADSHALMHSSVKRLRIAEERYQAEGYDPALNQQMQAHINYVASINAEKGKLEDAAKLLAEQLNRERGEREIERQGYQASAKLSTDQARHFADLCRAADMRIDELERMINEHAVQAGRERMQAQQFCKEYADKAGTYYDAAYQRELMVIKLLQDADIHKTNMNDTILLAS